MRRILTAVAFVIGVMFFAAGSNTAEARCIISPPQPCAQASHSQWKYVTIRLSDANWRALRQWGRNNGFSGSNCWWNANPTVGGVPKTTRSSTQSVRVRVRVGVKYYVDMPGWTGGLGHYQTFGPY